MSPKRVSLQLNCNILLKADGCPHLCFFRKIKKRLSFFYNGCTVNGNAPASAQVYFWYAFADGEEAWSSPPCCKCADYCTGDNRWTLAILHDGCSWHSSNNGPKAELQKLKLTEVRVGDKFPPRSMDLNPIENLFGNCMRELDTANSKKRPKSLQETRKRFDNACKKNAQKGAIANMAKSMPERCADVKANKGGPTRWWGMKKCILTWKM